MNKTGNIIKNLEHSWNWFFLLSSGFKITFSHLQIQRFHIKLPLASIVFFVLSIKFAYASIPTTQVTSTGANFWTAVATSANGTKIVAVSNNGNIGVGNGDIWISSDSGATWTLKTPSGPLHSQKFTSAVSDYSGVHLAVTIASGDIYTSSDSGSTWTNRTVSSSMSGKRWAGIASDYTGRYLVAVDSGSFGPAIYGGIWTSSDSGITWSQQTSNTDTTRYSSVASSRDGSHLIVGSDSGYYISTNSGLTWTNNNSFSPNCVASSADGNVLLAGVRGGYAYLSTNGGSTWTAQNSPLGSQDWIGVSMSADGRVLAATAWTGGTYLSTDSGSTFNTVTMALFGGPTDAISVSANGATLAIVAANDDIYYSSLLSVSSLSATTGTIGATVIITGTGFTNSSTVSFGSTAATSVIYNSSTSLTITVPNLITTVYDVQVTTAGVASSVWVGDQFTFTPVPLPTISTISPISGVTAGGTSVTITGTYLSGATVTVGGSAATIVSTSLNSITMTTPVVSAGARDVVVTTPSGSVTSIGSFTFVAPPLATSLVAGTSNFFKGNSTTLTPTFSAGTATINGVTDLIISGTPVTVSPTVTTIYTLTVTNSLSATATISSTITVIPSPTLTFANSSPSSLLVGSTLTNAVSSSLSGGNYGSIAYISSNTSIATVSTSGVVTAVGAGTATITALQYASDGNNSSAAASYPITVTAPVIPVAPVALVSAGISIINTTQTYTGQPLPVTVTTSPSNLTAAITYSPGFTTPTEAGTYYVLVNISGSSSYYGSQSSVLTILPAPQTVSIITPSIFNVGVPVILSAISKSNGPILFSLVSGNATLAGSTLTALDTNPIVVKAMQAGTNNYQAASALVNLTALQIKPAITIQPIAAVSVNQAGSTTLSVTASSNSGNTYQWYFNNAAIIGATSSIYSITNAQLVNAGAYTVIISNTAGSVTSNPSILSVLTSPTITTQPSNQVVASGSSAVLTVANNGSASTYQWYLNGTPIVGATAANYIMPLVNSTNTGSYTVGITNAAGAVTSNAATVSLASGTLVNLSDLGIINSSNTSYTTGFVISQGNETVLIRAVGPVLSTLGVTGVLTLPQLQLFDSLGKVIATNTAWGTSAVKGNSTASATIVPVTYSLMASAGAFSLPAGSNDCALIVTLPPGQYTAQVTALNGNSGKVMVEVYQVPNL